MIMEKKNGQKTSHILSSLSEGTWKYKVLEFGGKRGNGTTSIYAAIIYIYWLHRLTGGHVN